MTPASEVVEQLRTPGLGFERVELIQGTTYKDVSTIIIAPTRGAIPYQVVQSWQGLITPMNQKRAFLMCAGDEVGAAYNRMIANILAHPELSKWKYIMTVEDDNLQPPDAHVRLLETIEQHQFDAVSGLYFTKGELNMPMAYGNPEEYRTTGVLEFRPRNVTQALANGTVMEVNGIAMGCSLYRMDLFREIPGPWFVTVADVTEEGPKLFTQDLYFCERAKRAGKRFGVDMRVKVGHLDINTGLVY